MTIMATDLLMGNKIREGEALFSEGKIEDAKRIFSSIIENEPNSEEALNNLGVIAYKQGDIDTAVISFFKALEKDPSYKDALENLAGIFRIPEDSPLLISFLEKITAKTDHKAEDALRITQLLLNDLLPVPPPAKENNAAMKKLPLKILYLADCRSPHTKRQVRFFKDQGHEIHVFDTSGHSDDLHGIHLHFPPPIDTGRSDSSFEDFFIHNVFELNRLIDKIKPDILHGHYLTMWCWWGAFTGFQPFVTTAWGSDIFLDTRNDFNRRFTNFCLRESPVITADSMDLFETAAKLRGYKTGMNYIPFGIDVDFFRPGYNVAELAERLGVAGKKVVLSPRQFKPPANIDVIIRAIPKVVAEIPDTVFILKTYLTEASSLSEYERSLRDLVRDMKLQDHVLFLGDIDFAEIPVLYNLSDVMVTLRDTDGSACSMLECMACKTPVVASDIESMREWIKDGVNGRLVDHHSPEAVADAILEILLDQGKKSEFVNSGYALVNERADYRKNWSEVEDLYYGLITEGKHNSPGSREVGNSDLSFIHDSLTKAWSLIQSGKIDLGEKVFLQVIGIDKLPMHLFLKGLLGLARVKWMKQDFNNAKQIYMGCLNLIRNYDLDTHLDIKRAGTTRLATGE